MKDNNLYALTAAHNWNTSDNMWHTRLGHPSLKSLKFLNSNSCINISSWNEISTVCFSCQLGKSCKLHIGLRNKIDAPMESSQHMNYYVVFVDDHTRYTWIYPLKKMSEFFKVFIKF